jgi:hypothetical protein
MRWTMLKVCPVSAYENSEVISGQTHKIYKLKIGNKVVGWGMTSVEIQSFFKRLGKNVVTLIGFSGAEYQNKKGMLKISGQPKVALVGYIRLPNRWDL